MNQDHPAQDDTPTTATAPRTGKISRGFEELVDEAAKKKKADQKLHFDVVIVGSGYGGAVAAAKLSESRKPDGSRLSICVLERGKEYLPGSFPSSLSEIPRHVRFNIKGEDNARGVHDGLFDFRLNGDMSALIASGVGGGSLINAGVMEIPKESRFDQKWPAALHQGTALQAFYTEARLLLGAASQTSQQKIIDNTIKLASSRPEKYRAQKRLGKSAHFRPAAITVAMQDKSTRGGLNLKACNFCGDCATGCNFGAKESLDTNLLNMAVQNGVILYSDATVIGIKPELPAQNDGGERQKNKCWAIVATYSNKQLRGRHGEPVTITADQLILSAGSFGTTEILKRSKDRSLSFSGELGGNFSGNGDMLAAIYQQKKPVNAFSRHQLRPNEREVGPTITGIVEVDDASGSRPVIVQELAIPNAFSQLGEELISTAIALREISESDNSFHRTGYVKNDPFAVDDGAIARTSLVAIFGDDGPGGRLELSNKIDTKYGNGCINVSWKDVNKEDVFERQIELVKKLAGKRRIKGTVIPNPLWKFLPAGMEYLAESKQRGPLMTVHPLGGCVMADSVSDGVVDDVGRVYDPTNAGEDPFHDGLLVLDGSIIPSALETNPALTIAAVSLRAVEALKLRMGLVPPTKEVIYPEQDRVIYRDVMRDYDFNESLTAEPARPTEIQLIERMSGEAGYEGTEYKVEITLRSLPKDIKSLFSSGEKRMEVDTKQTGSEDDSRIRVVELDIWKCMTDGRLRDDELESKLDEAAALIAPLSGSISIFNRAWSWNMGRRARATWAWLLNRGLRDIYQELESSEKKNSGQAATKGISLKEIWKRAKGVWALSSRAGELRTLVYDLEIGKSIRVKENFIGSADYFKPGKKLKGLKKLTYSRKANPWRQLMELEMTNFPGDYKPVLKLDPRFLVRQGVPLVKIIGQQDQPTALVDCFSFIAYVARFLIYVHMWSFRLPDAYEKGTPNRKTERKLDNIPIPKVVPLGPLYPSPDPKEEVHAELTHYPNPKKPPLIAIHGYSIGGSIFTHEEIGTNLVQYFHENYDVWILDLRTSSNMPGTAKQSWKFEEVAFSDIPVAFDHIYKETGQAIYTFAHCMGAAMLSMALLEDPNNSHTYQSERAQLKDRIHSLALSQLGPRVNFSPGTLFRAYIMSYIQYLLPDEGIMFRDDSKEDSLAGMFIDRLLYTLPYPEDEFDLENPPWPPSAKTPFTRTRHRADFIYGRSYKLRNVAPKMRANLDDLFGSFNFITLTQVMQFARWKAIATRKGYNGYVSRTNLRNRWPRCRGTISIHGEENGLSDVSTLQLMEKTLKDSGTDFEYQSIESYGHMDCLMGKDSMNTFALVKAHFEKKGRTSLTPSIENTAHLPNIGPLIGNWITRKNGYVLPVAVGSSPGMTDEYFIIVIPVIKKNEKFIRMPDITPLPYSDAGKRELAKIAIPESIFDEKCDGVVVFTVHHDSDFLNDGAIGAYPFVDNGLILNLNDVIGPQLAITSTGPIFALLTTLKAFFKQFNQKILDGIDRRLQRPVGDILPCFIPKSVLSGLPKCLPESPTELRFALASCHYPPGMLDNEPAFDAYRRLNGRLDRDEDLSFVLLAGDQVYVDATAGLFDPITIEDRFQRPYQRLYRNQHVQNVMRRLPSINLIDDHEIDDNWEPGQTGPTGKDYLPDAVKAFKNWQLKSGVSGKLWDDQFKSGGFAFFVMDSRTERLPRRADNFDAVDMICPAQFEALEDWLTQPSPDNRPKFVVSPSMLFPRTREVAQSGGSAAAIRSDSWDGYPKTFDRLIKFLRDEKISNVVFLSGDAHLSLISDIEIGTVVDGPDQSVPTSILSIHSSGMYAPYQFANNRKEDFRLNESFLVSPEAGPQIMVDVKTCEKDIVPGDGFCIIEVAGKEEFWELTIEFDRAGKSTTRTRCFPK